MDREGMAILPLRKTGVVMPSRLTAQDFDPQVLILFDAYVHGRIDRRGFLEAAQKFATAGVTAAGLLAALSPDFALGQQVKPDDARLKTGRVKIPSASGSVNVNGYLCRPASAAANEKLPSVLVIHENRGLNPHIEDIARRLALEGFMALAPDALTPLGGYPGNEEQAVKLFSQLDPVKTRQDFLAAARWLRDRPDSNRKLGATGFCWGGGTVYQVAVEIPELDAAVPFYGPCPPPEDAAKIKAALLIHMARNDNFVNPTWPPFEAALRQARVNYRAYVYPKTVHGFNNDTTPRYDAQAAKLAWGRTVEFFKSRLAHGATMGGPASENKVR
jgi:carboxymethylenebutenolidase